MTYPRAQPGLRAGTLGNWPLLYAVFITCYSSEGNAKACIPVPSHHWSPLPFLALPTPKSPGLARAGSLDSSPVPAPSGTVGGLCMGGGRKGPTEVMHSKGNPRFFLSRSLNGQVHQAPGQEGQEVKGQGGVRVKSLVRWRGLMSWCLM